MSETDSPSTSPSTAESANSLTEVDRENIRSAREIVSQRLEFEAGWIGQRMTWLIISQSFLFGAFATTLFAGISAEPEHVRTASGIYARFFLLSDARAFLQVSIPVIAYIQAAVGYLGILAAKMVGNEMSTLQGALDREIRKLPYLKSFPLLGPKRDGPLILTYAFGSLPAHVMPLSLAGTWFLTLLLLAFNGSGVSNPVVGAAISIVSAAIVARMSYLGCKERLDLRTTGFWLLGGLFLPFVIGAVMSGQPASTGGTSPASSAEQYTAETRPSDV